MVLFTAYDLSPVTLEPINKKSQNLVKIFFLNGITVYDVMTTGLGDKF